MDTLTDFQKYTSVHPAVQKFRSWTELFIEITLAALFTIGFVAWSQTIIEAGGLVCVPSADDTSGFSLSEARYIGSKCQMTFGPRLLIFYPYFILINFGILLIAHILWSKIPSVVTKLSTFCALFNQIATLSPAFHKNSPSNRVLPSFDHEYQNKDKVKMLHERIIFMFLERSYIMKMYLKKCRLLSFICFISIFSTIMWIWMSNFGSTNYSCYIDYPTYNKTAQMYSCDASPSVYIFGVMIFHLFALLIIFGLSLYATFYSVSFKKNLDVFSSDENYDRFKGLPGIQDFVFCVSLLRTNFPDGLYTFHAVKYVLTQGQNVDLNDFGVGLPEVKVDLVEDPDVIKKKERYLSRLHKFDEGVLVVRYMIYELGLREIPNQQNRGHLYSCLEYIVKRCNVFNTQICNRSIRELIVDELINNRSYYKLILDVIDVVHPSDDFDTKNTTKAKYPFYKLERAIARVRDPNVWGDWISIAAICNVTNSKILLIHAGKTHGNLSKFIIDDFTPHNSSGSGHAFFMTYLEPHYYHVTESFIEPSESALENRLKYVSQPTERKILRKLAIRCVATNQSVDVRTIKKPEQPEKTVTPHKKRRFEVTTLSTNAAQPFTRFEKLINFSSSLSSSGELDEPENNDISTARRLYTPHPIYNNNNVNANNKGNNNELSVSSYYNPVQSFDTVRRHIQVAISRRDPIIDYRNFSSDESSDLKEE